MLSVFQTHQVLLTQLSELLKLLGDQKLSTSYSAPHLPEDYKDTQSLDRDKPAVHPFKPAHTVRTHFTVRLNLHELAEQTTLAVGAANSSV